MPSILNIALQTTGAAAVLNSLGGVTGALMGLGGAAISASAAIAGIKGALDIGGELSDLSARTGQTTRDLVILRRAFDNSGIGAANTAPMISLLQKAISGVNEQGDKTEAVFKRLGISADALKDMPAIEAMRSLTGAFESIKDPSERATIAMNLFGRSGAQMLQLLGDPTALRTAEREVGRLSDRVAQDANKFDEVGDRLSLAKLRLQEFYIVAAEKAIPSLIKMADVIDRFNPAVLGATLNNALSIAAILGGATFIKKFDNVMLDWATRQGAPIGQAFVGRFIAPFTGALARVLPIGVAAAVASEVLQGIANGYAEWRNSQLAAADSNFGALDRLRKRVSGIRSDADKTKALADVKELAQTTAAGLDAELARWIKNDQAIASYRV